MLQTVLAALTPGDLLILAYLVVFMPVKSIVSGARLRREPLDHARRMRRYRWTVMRGWAAVLAVLIVWFVADRPWDTLGLDWPIGMRGLAGFALVGLGTAFIAFELWRLSRLSAEKREMFKTRFEGMHILPRETSELPLFALMAMTAGVWEELLYRGFLMWVFTPLMGVVGAIVLSSFLFGIAHIYQGWKGVLRTGAVGLVFAAAYALTHSLWWLMLAHGFVDIAGGLTSWRVFRMQHEAEAAALA